MNNILLEFAKHLRYTKPKYILRKFMEKLSLKTRFCGKDNKYNKEAMPYPIDKAKNLVETAKILLIGQKINKILAYGWNGYYEDVIPSKTHPLLRENLDIYDWEGHFVFIIGEEKFEVALYEPNHYEIGLNTKVVDNVVDTRNIPEAALENLLAQNSIQYLDISHLFEDDIIGKKVKDIILAANSGDEYDYLGNVIIVLENGLKLLIDMALDNPGLHVVH